MFHAVGHAPVQLEFGTVHRVLSGGNHHPWLCQLEDASGPSGFWVVKPQHVVSRSTQRAQFGVLSELAAAEVCAWLDVPVPSLGLVRFPVDAGDVDVPAHLDERTRQEIRTTAEINAGQLAFCGRYLPEAHDLAAAVFVDGDTKAQLLDVGAKLFFLDAYMRHDDRQVENPNALWWTKRIVAIDHGNAFAGLSDTGKTGAGLAAMTVLSNVPRRHVLYESLRDVVTEVDISAAVQRLQSVADGVIDAAAAGWPKELDVRPRPRDEGLKTRLVRFLKNRRAVVPTIMDNVMAELRRQK
ncbi:MAG: hypothetical protein HYV09_40575 [Deltaproteobacteria bacterium]|nr:hypothetical protein [Deltaproteobacteria bacterium]